MEEESEDDDVVHAAAAKARSFVAEVDGKANGDVSFLSSKAQTLDEPNRITAPKSLQLGHSTCDIYAIMRRVAAPF